jgi:hypothetical protein
MPLVLTEDPKKRDELAEKIKSGDLTGPSTYAGFHSVSLEDEGYMVRVSSESLRSATEICPIRETVMFLASRDLPLLRSYVFGHMDEETQGEDKERDLDRFKDACVHAMHMFATRALHHTEGSPGDLVELSLMRRIVEKAFPRYWWWQSLFTMLSKNYGPQPVGPPPLRDVIKPRAAAWRTVAEILWEEDGWDGNTNVWSDLSLDEDENFESFVQNEEIPSNVSFWLYYLMTTKPTAEPTTCIDDVRFLFNLHYRNMIGTDAAHLMCNGGRGRGLMLMDSVIHAYMMLRRTALVAPTWFSAWFSMDLWSTIVALANSYMHDSMHGVHEDYVEFLQCEMNSWLNRHDKPKWTMEIPCEWYSETNRIIALFIQGLESLKKGLDSAQEIASRFLEDLLRAKPRIDWDSLASNFVHNYPQVMCYRTGTTREFFASEILSGCTYEKFDKFINEKIELSGKMRDNCMKLRAALGKKFDWGEDYMAVQKRVEKAIKLKRLRDSLDAYTDDGEDDPELKKMRLYLEQKSTQMISDVEKLSEISC